MVKTRSHYPVTVYGLTVVCALGLASVSVGIADGWILIVAGVTAVCVSLVRLHVILDRRRAGVDPANVPLTARPAPRHRR